MIPKTLHYCWFGNHPKSDIFLKCIESWRRFAPDFEIKEWNEKSSVPFQNKFYHDALRKGKYAFAADCIRVQVLYEYGGIYVDTDMLLVKSINELTQFTFFTGYEIEGRPAYGLFGAIPKNHLIEKMKRFYDTQFFNPFSPPVITHNFKEIITEDNLLESEKIFSKEYFYPLPYEHREEPYQNYMTSKTLAVHLWDHSWKGTKKESFWQLIKKLNEVFIDYFFFKYPSSYFKRYTKEFLRKMYHKLIGK